MHDPRIGRFFAIDPLTWQYPHNSPYAFSENDVIASVELEGLEKVPANEIWNLNRKGTTASVVTWDDVNYYSMRYATIEKHNVMCFPITAGPNKGNWAAYIVYSTYDIRKVYNYQLKGQFYVNPPEIDYIVGKYRAPERAHSGDLGNTAVGNIIDASSSTKDFSWSLNSVNWKNDQITRFNLGYWDAKTGNYIEPSTDQLISAEWKHWKSQQTVGAWAMAIANGVVATKIPVAAEENAVLYRNFGWNELGSIKNAGGKFSIHPNNFQGKQFWVGESGMKMWTSNRNFAKPFTAKINIPKSYVTPGNKNYIFMESDMIIDGYPGGTVLPNAIQKFNSKAKIDWIDFQ